MIICVSKEVKMSIELGERTRELLRDDFAYRISNVDKDYWPEFVKAHFGKGYDKKSSLRKNLKSDLSDEDKKKLHNYLIDKYACPFPKAPHSDKDTILFIGMNPAGDEIDAERDRVTDGLFLNYYPEFERLSEDFKKPSDKRSFVYSDYNKPILDFFVNDIGLGKDNLAWEWCNYSFDDLCAVINKYTSLNCDDTNILKECHAKYSKAKYQILVRDLVYYHQTNGFKELIKPITDSKTIVKDIIDSYIADLNPHIKRLRMIYVSTATVCNYVYDALSVPSKKSDLDDIGGIKYTYHHDGNAFEIPVFFAGRALSGQSAMDKFAKKRLVNAIKDNILF